MLKITKITLHQSVEKCWISLKLSPVERSERKGARCAGSCPAGAGCRALRPRWPLARREKLHSPRRRAPHAVPSMPRVQSLGSRRAHRPSATATRATSQPCGEVKLSNVIYTHRRCSVSVHVILHFYLTCASLCFRSGATVLENWIIRTNNGLSQVSYFGCWNQHGTSLFYHVHMCSSKDFASVGL